MDIFIYNSISLIDLGRRVFGQSALSPNRLSPNRPLPFFCEKETKNRPLSLKK